MSGISSSNGLISGINSSQIIDQLLQIEARPKSIIQRRVVELQRQQAAILDLNSKFAALRTAAAAFGSSRVFQLASAVTSNADVLGATASAGAPQGTYRFIVDRAVSTQQLLTRAFADRNTTAVGATGVTFESTRARLDSDTNLAQLNAGQGLARGKITVTDRAGNTATIDLSRVGTVSEVLKAINSNGTAQVTASVQGGRFVLTDNSAGTGQLSVRSVTGFTTAESLGLNQSVAASTITGSDVFRIGNNTTIASLRDNNGIRFNTAAGNGSFDFIIKARDGSSYNIDIGDLYDSQNVKTSGPAGTVDQLRQRISSQTAGKVTLQVRTDGRGFELVDSTTGTANFEVIDSSGSAADLGLVGSTAGGTITGTTILAGLNSTLASTLNAGQPPRDNTLNITTRSGGVANLTIDFSGSVSDVISQIQTGSGGRVTATLSGNGNSLVLTDVAGGTGNLIVSGGAAEALGLATAPAGVASSSVTGTRVKRQYIVESSALSTLNGGAGVGTGSFEIVGGNGNRATVNISSSDTTIGDVIKKINSFTSATNVRARINNDGNGILVEEDSGGGTGANRISITDTAGTVARSLNLAGTATGTGLSNFIDGSFRRTVTLGAGDTLDTVVSKVNGARAGVTANVVNDGSGATPFRIRFSAAQAGVAGRFLVDVDGTDLGANSIADGDDARVFFGSDDPTRAVLVSRSSNSIDGLVDGVRLDVRSASATPVSVTVSRDTAGIESAANDFITAYNALAKRVSDLTTFNASTQTKGTLLGDSTSSSLRSEIFNTVNGPALNVSGRFRQLSQVGVRFGAGGQLQLDSARLRAALDEDPQAVADLFAAKVVADRPTTRPVIPGQPGITTPNDAPLAYSSLGVAERVVQVAEKYLNASFGLLTGRNKSIDEEIARNNTRISDFDTRLATKRGILERQFANLESNLARLQRQQGALARINPTTSTSR